MDDDDDEVEMNDTPGRRSTRSGGARARPRRPKPTAAAAPEPKIKYMVQLQEVSNRERDSVTLELDDLKEVGYPAQLRDLLPR